MLTSGISTSMSGVGRRGGASRKGRGNVLVDTRRWSELADDDADNAVRALLLLLLPLPLDPLLVVSLLVLLARL